MRVFVVMAVVSALLAIVMAASWEGSPLASQAERFALVIGSHHGGPGQSALKYSGRDARRMAGVLTELGGFRPDQTAVLMDPAPAEVRAALRAATRAVEESRARGSDSVFLFYYFGHARATGLSLEGDELALDELRTALKAVRATVRLVILDACQSGTFSNVKGARAAESFSVQSTDRLDTHGSVVIASSSAFELSQESESLQASIFSHHLTTALRGAADRDRDGRISLDEAYEYAYRQTLVTSAATRVGRQHATIDTRLRGQGNFIVTQPSGAPSRLVFDEEVQGVLLVEHAASGAVFAEIDKVSGDRLTLAVPAGTYRVLVPGEGEIRTCSLAVTSRELVSVRPRDCPATPFGVGVQKGERKSAWWSGLSFEVSMGYAWPVDDGYTARLRDFGFSAHRISQPAFRYAVGAAIPIARHFESGLRFQLIDRNTFRRSDTRFGWLAHGAGAFVRFRWPVLSERLIPYVHGGVGVSFGSASFDAQTEGLFDYYVEGQAGLQVMVTQHFGVFGEAGLITSPLLHNELGDQHESGGNRFLLGLRARL